MSPALLKFLAGLALALYPVQAAFADSPPAPAPLTFAVGDELKISFYEPFNNDAKWAAVGQVREPGPSFYLHDELSGDFTVASDWTISLPVIGDVVVAHRTAAEVEDILAQDFTRVVGHPGFVNISIAARTPLYVLGLVNRPGVYPYAPDMTPLELVALAGGYQTSDTDSSVAAVNDSAGQVTELNQLRNALAQAAVLRAEINHTAPQSPQQLVDLMGKSEADALVAQAQADRNAVVQNQAAQVQALQSAVDAAKTTLIADQGRLQPTKDGTRVLQERLSSLNVLSRNGLATQPEILDAQSSALNSQDRQQDVLAAVAGDRHQLVLAKLALQNFISDNQQNLRDSLAGQQRDVDNLTPQVAASAEVIKLLTSKDAPADSGQIQFSIVRGGQLYSADLATGLQPGDVLQVGTGTDQPAPPLPPTDTGSSPSASLSQQSEAAACPYQAGCF
jgi:protein involved in polysaccharide export with SLBB domain